MLACCIGSKFADVGTQVEIFPILDLVEDMQNCYDFSVGVL